MIIDNSIRTYSSRVFLAMRLLFADVSDTMNID